MNQVKVRPFCIEKVYIFLYINATRKEMEITRMRERPAEGEGTGRNADSTVSLSEEFGHHKDDGAAVLLKQRIEDSFVGEPHPSEDVEL